MRQCWFACATLISNLQTSPRKHNMKNSSNKNKRSTSQLSLQRTLRVLMRDCEWPLAFEEKKLISCLGVRKQFNRLWGWITSEFYLFTFICGWIYVWTAILCWSASNELKVWPIFAFLGSSHINVLITVFWKQIRVLVQYLVLLEKSVLSKYLWPVFNISILVHRPREEQDSYPKNLLFYTPPVGRSNNIEPPNIECGSQSSRYLSDLSSYPGPKKRNVDDVNS